MNLPNSKSRNLDSIESIENEQGKDTSPSPSISHETQRENEETFDKLQYEISTEEVNAGKLREKSRH